MNSKFSFGLVIFSSAFLLFQVQPMLGKMILPWFGGSAGVWIVCLLFFQVVLLLGYCYAHLLVRAFRVPAQGRIHAALLAVSLLALPIMPRESWKPLTSALPALHILGVLTLTVGLPYFLLASTSPLLQAWYARRDVGMVPYRFYALSNVGSMLALLSYPIIVEPWVATSRQGTGWSWAYAGAALVCALLAISSTRSREIASASRQENSPAPGWQVQILWIALAACGSALLLAITHHLTQNLAAVPLLWVLPLALYLLSFILCFASGTWYRRGLFIRLLGVALGSMAYALTPSFAGLPLKVSIPLFCSSLLICCMFCHGELAQLKPHPAHLTTFYLLTSLGGAIGGLFVALVAPQLFAGDHELSIAIGFCALLVLVVLHRDPASPFHQARWEIPWLLVVTLAAAIIISLGLSAREDARGARLRVRNFYGSLRIVEQSAPTTAFTMGGTLRPAAEDLRFKKLMNGTIDHGLQFQSPALRDRPTTYFGPDSGIGVALIAAGSSSRLNVGVIGLGAGTLAAWGRPGDRFRFYEINPLVVQIANRDFTFLRDSTATIEIVLGDGRLSLEREQPQAFDVLAVDAFSGDSIPVHLLTREAMEIYFRHLKPGGVLAVHVSNQFLNLVPIVGATSAGLGKRALVVENQADSQRGIYRSTWVLVGSADGALAAPGIQKAGTPLVATHAQAQWTDDYSSLFQALR